MLLAGCGSDDGSNEGRYSEELGVWAFGDWRFIDDFGGDDQPGYLALQIQFDEEPQRGGATLHVRCRPNDAEGPFHVYVSFSGERFTSLGGTAIALTEVFFTIGDISSSAWWAVSSKNQDTLLSPNAELMAQLMAVIDADTITITTTNEQDEPLEQAFSLDGAKRRSAESSNHVKGRIRAASNSQWSAGRDLTRESWLCRPLLSPLGHRRRCGRRSGQR